MIVKLLSIVLLLTACYLCWWTAKYAQSFWHLATLVLTACAIGLLFKRDWASYLWYGIGSVVTAVWLLNIMQLALDGWPVAGTVDTIISLLPGALLLFVCIGGSMAVRHDLRQRRHR